MANNSRDRLSRVTEERNRNVQLLIRQQMQQLRRRHVGKALVTEGATPKTRSVEAKDFATVD